MKESTTLALRQYSPVCKVKIYSGTDNFQTTFRHFGLHTRASAATKHANNTNAQKSHDYYYYYHHHHHRARAKYE